MTPPPTYVGCCFVTLYSALFYCIQRRSTTNIPELWLRTQLYRSSPILWSRRKFSLPCALRSKGSLWIKMASFWRSLLLDEIRVLVSLGKADCLPEGRENGDISVDGINIWNRFKNKMVLFIPPVHQILVQGWHLGPVWLEEARGLFIEMRTVRKEL